MEYCPGHKNSYIFLAWTPLVAHEPASIAVAFKRSIGLNLWLCLVCWGNKEKKKNKTKQKKERKGVVVV